MIFCSIIDRVMNFFKMSTSLVAGFMCIFSIYIVNGAPLMNVDVSQQTPATGSADHLSMFKVSEIMDNMTLNDIGTEGGYVVDETLCKSILTKLSSSNKTETFRSAASNIEDHTGSYEAQKTIVNKISTALQLCQQLEITESDIQSLNEILDNTIFEEIRAEKAQPIESDEVNEKKSTDVSTNLHEEDNLKSDHVNVSRSLIDEPEYGNDESAYDEDEHDDSVPIFRSAQQSPGRKGSKSRNAAQYFFSKPLAPDSEDTSNTLLLPNRKLGSSNAMDDNMASKIFLFNGHVGPSFNPAAMETKSQKTRFLFNRDPFAAYSNVPTKLERKKEFKKKYVQDLR
ncbi:uncharacterized protein LOC135839793 [Planococcus citri]|uniref:uncharacterized protein LOC135839793 n=1 Tax=Planococcus citri TaxID=170843 RepID=UPI0031F734F0